jgi:hypothetical protein
MKAVLRTQGRYIAAIFLGTSKLSDMQPGCGGRCFPPDWTPQPVVPRLMWRLLSTPSELADE